MSHMMTQNDKMYSVRQAPWHMGMGTNVIMLDVAPETRSDRITAAGHNFTVMESPIFELGNQPAFYTPNNDPIYQPIDGWKVIKRDDTGDVLHVAKDSYTVVQNIVGHELFEILAANARLDDGTGGTVKNGAVCYLSARLDEPYMIAGDNSPVYPYLVVIWTHDGSGAVSVRMTSVRVVCWNTISLSEMEAKRTGRQFTFKHTTNVMDNIEAAKAALAGAREETKRFIELGNELASIKVTAQQREDFITEFIPAPATNMVISDRVLDNILMARAQVRSIYDSPTIPDEHQFSAFGMLMAGTEYLDHLRGYNNKDTHLGRTLLRDEPAKKKLIPMIRELVAA